MPPRPSPGAGTRVSERRVAMWHLDKRRVIWYLSIVNRRRFLSLVLLSAAPLAFMNRAFPQCFVHQFNGRTSYPLYGVSFPTASHGTAVGFSGTILHTTDAGLTWIQQSAGLSTLYDVFFCDTAVGYAVGYAGTILRTADGGSGWVSLASDTTSPFYGVSFSSRTTGTVVGDNGLILRTTDGGLNWITQNSGTTLPLRSVFFTDSLTGTISGWGGKILGTNDGGATWRAESSYTKQVLWKVFFTDAADGYIVGDHGIILRTTDGGTTWDSVASGTTNYLSGLSFADRSDGMAVGGGGTIIQTTDGGVTWLPSRCQNFNLYACALSAGRSATGVGTSGIIAHSTDTCASSAPVLPVAPADGAVNIPLKVNVQWGYLPYIDLIGFHLQVSTDSAFPGALTLDTTIQIAPAMFILSCMVEHLHTQMKYYWHVRALFVDGSANDWTGVRSFSTFLGGSISGTVFEDSNQDTIFNPGEPTLNKWFVQLSGKTSGSVETGVDGKYSFAGLDSGTYVVTETVLPSWKATVPPGGSYTIVLGIDEAAAGKNFGNYFGFWNTVSGVLYHDLNENGARDPGEEGIAGWKVSLTGTTSADDSTLTDSADNYSFKRLDLGLNTITVTVLPAWEQIYPILQQGYSLDLHGYDEHFTGMDFSVHRIPSRVKLTITVRDSTSFGKRDIWCGVRPGATYGIWGVDSSATNVDFSEGEFDLPPQLPGLFDARFKDPQQTLARFGNGSWTDMRAYVSPDQIDTFFISFKPGTAYGGDYPMTLRWSKAQVESLYSGPVILLDPFGWMLDMKNNDSTLVTNPNISSVLLIAEHPVLPVVSVAPPQAGAPREFRLEQNYPNPFNPTTDIQYQISEIGFVSLKIYDLLGREVATLVNEMKPPGIYHVRWDANSAASGLYFYRLVSVERSGRSRVSVRKMVLIR